MYIRFNLVSGSGSLFKSRFGVTFQAKANNKPEFIARNVEFKDTSCEPADDWVDVLRVWLSVCRIQGHGEFGSLAERVASARRQVGSCFGPVWPLPIGHAPPGAVGPNSSNAGDAFRPFRCHSRVHARGECLGRCRLPLSTPNHIVLSVLLQPHLFPNDEGISFRDEDWRANTDQCTLELPFTMAAVSDDRTSFVVHWHCVKFKNTETSSLAEN